MEIKWMAMGLNYFHKKTPKNGAKALTSFHLRESELIQRYRIFINYANLNINYISL